MAGGFVRRRCVVKWWEAEQQGILTFASAENLEEEDLQAMSRNETTFTFRETPVEWFVGVLRKLHANHLDHQYATTPEERERVEKARKNLIAESEREIEDEESSHSGEKGKDRGMGNGKGKAKARGKKAAGQGSAVAVVDDDVVQEAAALSLKTQSRRASVFVNILRTPGMLMAMMNLVAVNTHFRNESWLFDLPSMTKVFTNGFGGVCP
jgi:hypothetical protein